MAKVSVNLQVDEEVINVGNALLKVINDVKGGPPSYIAISMDIVETMAPCLKSLMKLPGELKTSANNRAYLAMVLEEVVEVLLMAPPAPPAPAEEAAAPMVVERQ